MLVTWLKEVLLTAVSRLTGRHAVLLPGEAAGERRLLRLTAPYRAEGDRLTVELAEPPGGHLTARLLAYEGHFPRRPLWSGEPRPFPGPSCLSLDLEDGRVELGGEIWGRVPLPLSGRRLAWELILDGPTGRRRRLTGHYLPGRPGPTDASYFSGENYVDHEAESTGDGAEILTLLRHHGGTGPVLEIGCATGGVLAALAREGFEAWGMDFSPWAVERARERPGEPRAFVCDLENDPLPPEIEARAPFGALVLWMVLEHFHHPFEVLARLTRLLAPGGLLLVDTTNADGLTHRLFGPDWEGYFDATHHGVEQVGVESLRRQLPGLGWEIRELATHHLWASNADPTAATLREWYVADARFRLLLTERNLGDFVRVIAVRRGDSG